MTAVYNRYDRYGRMQFSTSPETRRALEVLSATMERGEREATEAAKARQESGDLTLDDRLLRSIFGNVK